MNKSLSSSINDNNLNNTQLITMREGNFNEPIFENEEYGRKFTDDTFVSQ
jgi:hypothetical protein